GRNEKLGGQVALLGELRVVKRGVRAVEIGATILLVGVEEERVQPTVEVIMVSNVAERARTRVELLQPPEQVTYQPPGQGPLGNGDAFLPKEKRQHIRNRALLDDKSAVHVGFA